jgi:hypothetical protein
VLIKHIRSCPSYLEGILYVLNLKTRHAVVTTDSQILVQRYLSGVPPKFLAASKSTWSTFHLEARLWIFFCHTVIPEWSGLHSQQRCLGCSLRESFSPDMRTLAGRVRPREVTVSRRVQMYLQVSCIPSRCSEQAQRYTEQNYAALTLWTFILQVPGSNLRWVTNSRGIAKTRIILALLRIEARSQPINFLNYSVSFWLRARILFLTGWHRCKTLVSYWGRVRLEYRPEKRL